MKKIIVLFIAAFLFGLFVPAAIQEDLFQPRYVLVTESDKHRLPRYVLVTESDKHRFFEDTKTKLIIMQNKDTGEVVNLNKKYGEIF